MKLRVFAFAVFWAVFAHGVVFAQTLSAADYFKRGKEFLDNGDYYNAMENFNRAVQLRPNFAEAINGRGEIYFYNSDYTAAEKEFSAAIKINPRYERALFNRGKIFQIYGDYDRAIADYSKAIELNPGNSEAKEKLADLYCVRAAQKQGNGDIAGAIDDWTLACSISTENVEARYILGRLYYNMGDYAKAIPFNLELIAIQEMTFGKEHPDYATSLNNLGMLYYNQGEYDKAGSYHLEALAVREKTLGKEHPNYAESLNNLGALYYSMGDYAKAERYYLETAAIYKKTPEKEHLDYATSLNNMGVLYASMGDYAKAERYYLEVAAIYEKAHGKEHPSYAQSLNNIGNLYLIMGDYEKARSCLLEAKAIYEKVPGKEHPVYAFSLISLGGLYYGMGDYAKAENYHLEAKVIIEKLLDREDPFYATFLNNQGGLYYSMGDYAKAERYYLEVAAIYEKARGKEHPSYAVSLDNLYLLYLDKKEYAQALAYKQEQIKIKIGIVNKNFSFQTEQQRDAYWNANSSSFEASYSLSFYHPLPESNILNYETALFSKGLLLRTTNAVRDAIYTSGNQALISQFEELGRLHQQISALRQKEGSKEEYIKSLEAYAESLEKTLTRSSKEFKEFQVNLAVNWQTIQKSLQKNEAAIEFVSFRIYNKKWTDTVQYAALVLKKDSKAPEWIPLCEENVLTDFFKKLEELRLSKKEWLPGELQLAQIRLLYDEYGPALYNAVWRPLEKTLGNVKTVYYSPSGLLHKISFSAIPVNAKTRLMDKYGLNLVSSTREVIYLKNKKAGKPGSAVIYGGLEYNVDADTMRREALAYNAPDTGTRITSAPPNDGSRGGSWRYLLWANEESKDIQRLLESNKIPVTLYSGAKGNKESFKNLSARKTPVIHLATHGFFIHDIEKNYEDRERLERFGGKQKVFENPLLRSGLILAGANTWAETNTWAENPLEGVENGILLADDVAKMNLVGTELVVMSACETGLGTVNNSEGVFGLQRAFKLAGAQTLIMSLWEVDDRGTGIIMNEFYKNWLSGKSKQDAFKEAQRSLRSDSRYESPFYWAAFVMMD